MYKLQPHSLTRISWFKVETQGLDLAEKDSQTTFDLPLEGQEIAAGDWLLDETDPGAGTVWRVKSIETNYTTQTRTVSAEHIIKTLRDTCIFGEVTPQDMGGSATECTAAQAISYALARQSDWTLGGLSYTKSAGYSFNGDTVYDAIGTVCTTLAACWWSYDLTSYPFKLYIAPKNTADVCEMREARNISTLRMSIDRSRMYTRVYLIGKDNMHITGDYLSKNEAVYGTVSKVLTDQSLDTEAALRAWGQARLDAHCEPSVNVTITGLELSERTGEQLDRLAVGRMCRVPLPEWNTTILETITKLKWRDKIAEPENVSVTLANDIVDLASIIRQEMSEGSGSGGRGGRGAAKNAEEDHAWFVDTTTHVAMVAEAVAGEGAAEDWSRVAQIVVDGNGIHQRVTEAEGDLVTHESRIEATERSITQEVADRTNADGALQSSITQTANQIALKVSKGDVATQLAVECGNVTITGGNLTVDGTITTNNMESIDAMFKSVGARDIAASGSLSIKDGNSYYAVQRSISGVQISQSGNTYTLQYQKWGDSSWTDVSPSFSRAVSSVAWSWSGGMAKAVLTPQNQTFYSKQLDAIQPHGQQTWDNDNKGFTVTLDVDDTDGTTAYSEAVHFSTLTSYNAGVTEGEGHFTPATVTAAVNGGYVTAINTNTGIKLSVAQKYEAGSPYTLYESGSPFDYQDVGSTTVYTRSNRMSLKYVGTISGQSGVFYKVESGGTDYYQTSQFTPTRRQGTRRGSQVTGTNLGSPVAVYVSDTNGTQYYQPGTTSYLYSASSVSNTYYTKNS